MSEYLDPTIAAWHVMATAGDPDDKLAPDRLRPISRNFSAKSAAEEFCALAKAQYPDAYVQAVPVKPRKTDARYA